MQTAYANDTTFSWNDKKSVTEVFKTLDHFSLFSGLKPNISKCEICGIGALKGVTKALRGMRCINLENDMVKICYNPLLLKNAKRKNTITENIKNWKIFIKKSSKNGDIFYLHSQMFYRQKIPELSGVKNK